jgi:hypothetical protein
VLEVAEGGFQVIQEVQQRGVSMLSVFDQQHHRP